MIKINLEDMEYKKNCCGCEACVNACPRNCILMKEDSEGFLYPFVNSALCTNCGICEDVCPIKEKVDEDKDEGTIAYAAINSNENIRMQSSSGGIFTLLAEKVIEDGGVVFGAILSEDYKSVYHVGVHTVEELSKLRGSKYLQSISGDVYTQVRELLEKNIKVLFTGTPCQIEGLYSFLRKEYAILVCVDFICHGVPSPKVWRTYIEFRKNQIKETNAELLEIQFRNKQLGWKNYSILMKFSNQDKYNASFDEDLYMKAFLNDAILRPSCYECKFKKMHRKSDITIADFWGIQNVIPEMDDDKGTSLVIIHSAVGEKIFESIVSQIKCKTVDIDVAISENPSMIKSVSEHKSRQQFFENLETIPFDKLVRKYAKPKNQFRYYLVQLLKQVGVFHLLQNIKSRIVGRR